MWHVDIAAFLGPRAARTARAFWARLAWGKSGDAGPAGPFEMSRPAVTKHLKVLERAGLITRSREAQWRPCKLEAAPLQGVSSWVEQYRQFWEERLDRLREYLRELQAQEAAQAARPQTAGSP